MTSQCSLCQELNKSAENQLELIEEALSEHASDHRQGDELTQDTEVIPMVPWP